LAVRIPGVVARIGIEGLDLSVRSYNALKAHGINNLGQLLQLSDSELLDYDNLGRKSLADVKRAIAKVLSAPDMAAEYANQGASAGSAIPDDGNRLSPGGWNTPTYRPELLDTPIDLLDLSARPTNVLAHLQVLTVGQLLNYPKRELVSAENIGRKSMAELEAKLFSYLSGPLNPATEPEGTILPIGEPSRTAGIKEFVDQILCCLPDRQREILADRYGLWDGIAETLQDIGDKLGLTRERIRQIEAKGLKRIRRLYGHGRISSYIFEKIRSQIAAGESAMNGVISEDEIVDALAVGCTEEQSGLALEFLQDVNSSVDNLLARSLVEAESGVYCVDRSTADTYQEVLRAIESILQSREKPLTEGLLLKEITSRFGDSLNAPQSRLAPRILGVSSKVSRLRNGTVTLSQWTEFRSHNAPGVAEAALRVLGRPAHFREITEKVGSLFGEARSLNERTIHQALLTNRKQFVWIKNGTYGLAAWGLKKPPFLKDRLIELLSVARYPLPLWHLEEKVLEVCNCKLKSIRMTLDLNPKLFAKFGGEQYGLQQHYSD
jgi:hypothetical protein